MCERKVAEESPEELERLSVQDDDRVGGDQPQECNNDVSNSNNDDSENAFLSSSSCLRPLAGIGVSALAAFLFSISNVFIKEAEDLSTFVIATYRNAMMLMFSTPILIDKSLHPFPKGYRLLLLSRSLLGFAAQALHYYSVKHMPLADALMVTATAPAFAAIFGRIFATEKISVLSVVNLLLALVGVALIVKPTFFFDGGESSPAYDDPEYPYAAAGAAVGAVVQGAVYVQLGLLREVDFSVVLVVYGGTCLVASTVAATFAPPFFGGGGLCLPTCPDRWLMAGIGCFVFMGQIGFTIAPRLEKAAVVALINKTASVLLALLFQMFWFQEMPGAYSAIGAAIVLTVILSSGGKKILDDLPGDHRVKQRYLSLCYRASAKEDCATTGGEEDEVKGSLQENR